MEEITTTEKYPLQKTFQEEEKLKIFFMCVQDKSTIPPKVKFVGVISYRHLDAVEKARKMWAENQPRVFIASHGDFEFMEEILKRVNCEGITIINQIPVRSPENPKKIGKDQLKYDLMLVLDDYVKDEEKRKVLKNIIEEIK